MENQEWQTVYAGPNATGERYLPSSAIKSLSNGMQLPQEQERARLQVSSMCSTKKIARKPSDTEV